MPDSVMTGSTGSASRDAVASGLLPIMRIADRPVRWTMDERLAHYACPGVSVAVMRDGRIDWVDGFGSRTAGAVGDVCGPDTVFMMASCAKPVTALLVLQQVERGVLDLDVDVNRYLQRWQVPANELTAAHPVTLRGALSHTAGLTVNGWGGVVRDGSPVPTVFDLLDGRPPSRLGPVVVDRAFDGTDRYSGGGYLIALLVLEDVLGRPFTDLADEMVFGPLGMTRSTYRVPLSDELEADLATGHGDDGRPIPGRWLVPAESAAGGLFSTARDYATFLLGLRAAVRGEPGAVLGPDLARQMTTRQHRGAFGLGVRVLGSGPATRISHGGSNDAYQCESTLYLDSGDGAVVLTNATSGLLLFREVLNAIADADGWPAYMPAPKRLRTLTADEMQRYAGTYGISMGVEMPMLRVWVEDGRLWNEVPGLRFGVQEVFCGDDGLLFNQTGPFETEVVFGADGRASDLVVREGDVTILRAQRLADEPRTAGQVS